MDLKTELRYKGYAATPPLWKRNLVLQFPQIELNLNSKINNNSIVFKNSRLGKLVEEFVFYQLKEEDSINWICDNLQIQNGKQTIGEIDALYYHKEEPIHLEIVYKFYLYDTLKTYEDRLGYWIGPNRKDSLLYKLEKLYNKQFPILYEELVKPYLDTFNLKQSEITQSLCFKAQLFLPYNHSSIDIGTLNSKCISGYYITFNKIEELKNYEFYIPEKLDWLIIPHQNVDWVYYDSALKIIENAIYNKRSPLVWLKQNDKLQKYFITFW